MALELIPRCGSGLHHKVSKSLGAVGTLTCSLAGLRGDTGGSNTLARVSRPASVKSISLQGSRERARGAAGASRALTPHSAAQRGRGQGGWPREVAPLQPQRPQATDLCSARQAVASAGLRCRSCGCPWHRACRSCTWWVRYSAMKPMKSLAGLGEGWA